MTSMRLANSNENQYASMQCNKTGSACISVCCYIEADLLLKDRKVLGPSMGELLSCNALQ